jgi:hypothetical protein
MSTALETTTDVEMAEPANPFLQFVDPRRYRELVELANKHTEPARLVSPLSQAPLKPIRSDADRPERKSRPSDAYERARSALARNGTLLYRVMLPGGPSSEPQPPVVVRVDPRLVD